MGDFLLVGFLLTFLSIVFGNFEDDFFITKFIKKIESDINKFTDKLEESILGRIMIILLIIMSVPIMLISYVLFGYIYLTFVSIYLTYKLFIWIIKG